VFERVSEKSRGFSTLASGFAEVLIVEHETRIILGAKNHDAVGITH